MLVFSNFSIAQTENIRFAHGSISSEVALSTSQNLLRTWLLPPDMLCLATFPSSTSSVLSSIFDLPPCPFLLHPRFLLPSLPAEATTGEKSDTRCWRWLSHANDGALERSIGNPSVPLHSKCARPRRCAPRTLNLTRMQHQQRFQEVVLPWWVVGAPTKISCIFWWWQCVCLNP